MVAAEPGARRHAELALDVILCVHQHAACGLLVPAGSTGLLKIVLKRPRDVGVNNEAHVRLVYSHAEGVGGDDRPQLPTDEALLYVLLGLGRQSGMEVIRVNAFLPQEFCHLLCLRSRRAVDYRAAGFVCRKIGRQYLMYIGELGGAARRYHHELQVGALRSTVEHLKLHAQLFSEVFDDFGLHVRLCGGGKAHDRRHRLIPCSLADEPSHISVVWPEVVPPL